MAQCSHKINELTPDLAVHLSGRGQYVAVMATLINDRWSYTLLPRCRWL